MHIQLIYSFQFVRIELAEVMVEGVRQWRPVHKQRPWRPQTMTIKGITWRNLSNDVVNLAIS